MSQWSSPAPNEIYTSTDVSCGPAHRGTNIAAGAGGKALLPPGATPPTMYDLVVSCGGMAASDKDLLKAVATATSHLQNNHAGHTGVLVLPNGATGRSRAVAAAINHATSQGLLVVAPAGDNQADACGYSTMHSSRALRIGGVKYTGSGNLQTDSFTWQEVDIDTSYSNHGLCVDLFAPGTLVGGADPSSWSGTAQTETGTSFAAGLVAGLAARRLEVLQGLDAEALRRVVITGAITGAVPGGLPCHAAPWV